MEPADVPGQRLCELIIDRLLDLGQVKTFIEPVITTFPHDVGPLYFHKNFTVDHADRINGQWPGRRPGNVPAIQTKNTGMAWTNDLPFLTIPIHQTSQMGANSGKRLECVMRSDDQNSAASYDDFFAAPHRDVINAADLFHLRYGPAAHHRPQVRQGRIQD